MLDKQQIVIGGVDKQKPENFWIDKMELERVHQDMMFVLYIQKVMKITPCLARGFWWN